MVYVTQKCFLKAAIYQFRRWMNVIHKESVISEIFLLDKNRLEKQISILEQWKIKLETWPCTVIFLSNTCRPICQTCKGVFWIYGRLNGDDLKCEISKYLEILFKICNVTTEKLLPKVNSLKTNLLFILDWSCMKWNVSISMNMKIQMRQRERHLSESFLYAHVCINWLF